MKIEATFIEPVLGTLAGNPQTATEFILSKNKKDQPEQDEVDALPPEEALENKSTVFPKEDGKPFLWNYQLKGHFKKACLAMIMSGTMTKDELKKLGLTNYLYKRTIDLLLFCTPRKMFFTLPKGGEIEFLERPLRGETARGERISLARSEMLPAGTTFAAEITTMNPKLEPFIVKWLDYGAIHGLLQWRNASFGSFTYKILK
ncbi:MAG: hypothetical protein PHY02_10790 [Phycisphaerae bacterium]|nr:hypothetical protein [Phycisphaerae bacterium]